MSIYLIEKCLPKSDSIDMKCIRMSKAKIVFSFHVYAMNRDFKKGIKHLKIKFFHEMNTFSHIFSYRLIVTLVIHPDPLFCQIAQLTLWGVLTQPDEQKPKETLTRLFKKILPLEWYQNSNCNTTFLLH